MFKFYLTKNDELIRKKKSYRNCLVCGSFCLLFIEPSAAITSSKSQRNDGSDGSSSRLFLHAATITAATCVIGLPINFLKRQRFVPAKKTLSASTIANAQMPQPHLRPTSSCMQTRTVTARREPTLIQKKKRLKKYVICDRSFGSVSSNWSDPKPETLAFTPPVPRAVRYKAKYKTVSCIPLACTQLDDVVGLHLGGLSPGMIVERVKIETP